MADSEASLPRMRLILLYGPPATGKLTIGRLVAARTGMALFHNHLVVDAVGAVFPFGSDAFVRLRERFWLDTIAAAAAEGRSLIFTFAPEPSVAPDFPVRLVRLVEAAKGEIVPVALTLDPAEQERRLVADDRSAFGKLRSVALLRELRASMDACMAAMPTPRLRLDTGATTAAEAADLIATALGARAAASGA